MLLTQIRLRSFRSYDDTGDLTLRPLNVFIGANNAGKTALLSCIELFFRSFDSLPLHRVVNSPLQFEAMPSFLAFDSLLRRTSPRPGNFSIDYSWREPPFRGPDVTVGPLELKVAFKCRERAADRGTYVSDASYEFPEGPLVLSTTAPGKDGGLAGPWGGSHREEPQRVMVQFKHKQHEGVTPIGFLGLMPYFPVPDGPLRTLTDKYIFRWRPELEVVFPSRPVPRSFYVLDDPGLSSPDRALVSYLIEVWNRSDDVGQSIRHRIVDNLRTLGLVRSLEVRSMSGRRGGPKVVAIQAAPHRRTPRSTIADVGFGVSQVLPLAVSEARLFSGCLIAYQPEVHLHPLAQSRLADIFATSSVARHNQVFVETHSQDFVLRLQALVASKELPPESVRVFCLQNVKGTTKVTPVDLDERGAPSFPWPAGFLDTSLSLARDLAARRHA